MNDPPLNPTRGTRPCWSTTCFGEMAQTLPSELSALGEHLTSCRSLTGRWFTIACAAEATRTFVAARIVTSLVLVAMLAGLGLQAW